MQPLSRVEEQMVDVGQVRLHVVTAGEGRPVVLLHGFPSFWGSWSHQIDGLVAAGFRVVAPDLRGYNLSDKPLGVEHYTLDRLAGDVAGLVRALGYERAAIVGHDWGGAAAWATVLRHPEVVERLAVLNSPHPAIMKRKLFTPRQLLKCWYMFAFLLPDLPEWLVGQSVVMRLALRGISYNKKAFSDADVAAHVRAMRQPGAATATINYYRARFTQKVPPAPGPASLVTPTLVVYGRRDPIFGPDLFEGTDRFGAQVQVQSLETGHWPQVERPEAVNQHLLQFLA